MTRFFLRFDNSKKDGKQILAYVFRTYVSAISCSSETVKMIKGKRKLHNIREGVKRRKILNSFF